RRHTIFSRDWSSDVCSSDLPRADVLRRRRSGHPERVLRRPLLRLADRVDGTPRIERGLEAEARPRARSHELDVRGGSIDENRANDARHARLEDEERRDPAAARPDGESVPVRRAHVIEIDPRVADGHRADAEAGEVRGKAWGEPEAAH